MTFTLACGNETEACGLPDISADTADLNSIDFRSVCSRLLDFLTEDPFIGHLSRENVIGGKTVELTVRPTVKLKAFSGIRITSR